MSHPSVLNHGHKSNVNLTAKEKTTALIDAMNNKRILSSSIDNLQTLSPDKKTLVVTDTPQYHTQQPR
jgi:hypothetical protein